MRQAWEGEVKEDTALNDQDQQHRQAHGLERKEQDQNDKDHRQDGDHHVIMGKGRRQVIVARGVAH